MHDPAVGLRAPIVEALAKLEAGPQLVVQPLLLLMKSAKEVGVLQAANGYFRNHKTLADRLVPILVAVVMEDGELRNTAILALGVTGPAAKSALPVLKDALRNGP